MALHRLTSIEVGVPEVAPVAEFYRDLGLVDTPTGAARSLEARLAEAQRSLAAVTAQNERLAGTLRDARDQILKLKEEVDRLAQPGGGLNRVDDHVIGQGQQGAVFLPPGRGVEQGGNGAAAGGLQDGAQGA